jgi:hypothetical protein
MARGKRNDNSKSNEATLGFKATLWAAADKLRNNVDDPVHTDSFPRDPHMGPRAYTILANPMFNVSDGRVELFSNDNRWQYGIPSMVRVEVRAYGTVSCPYFPGGRN